MSQHFTYELNEQVLRNQMQEFEVSFRDEAWQRFEAYSLSQVKPAAPGAFQKIQLRLNRNVVLPAGFGVVVLAFSLLLFNFVSIKDEERADIDTAQPVCPVVHAGKQSDASAEGEVSGAAQAVVSFASQKGPLMPVQAESQPATPAADMKSQAVNTSVADESAIGTAEGSVKRRKRTIPAETLREIRPTMVTEDLEPEIRPN